MTQTRTLNLADIDHAVIAGWTPRDRVALESHIEELVAIGLTRPARTPSFYPIPASLLTTSGAIQVVGGETSGEVEIVLVHLTDGLWIGLGSDHTDRKLETTSVLLSKHVSAKPVALGLWRLDELEPHWDSLALRSWATRGDVRSLYQDGTTAATLPPRELIKEYESASGRSFAVGTAMFCGTLATVEGIGPADSFECELVDNTLQRDLRLRYDIEVLSTIS